MDIRTGSHEAFIGQFYNVEGAVGLLRIAHRTGPENIPRRTYFHKILVGVIVVCTGISAPGTGLACNYDVAVGSDNSGVGHVLIVGTATNASCPDCIAIAIHPGQKNVIMRCGEVKPHIAHQYKIGFGDL